MTAGMTREEITNNLFDIESKIKKIIYTGISMKLENAEILAILANVWVEVKELLYLAEELEWRKNNGHS